jgi:hypothetical protein
MMKWRRVWLLALCLALICGPAALASWYEYSREELDRLHDLVGQFGIQSVSEVPGAVGMGVSDNCSENLDAIREAVRAMGIDPEGILFYDENGLEANDWFVDYTEAQTDAGMFYHDVFSLSEVCYHATPLCIDAGGASDPITEEEARENGLLPCPICVRTASDAEGVSAVARGGTYVLRITDEWMNSRTDIGSVFGFFSTMAFTGEDIMKPLAERVHGDDYVAFVEAIQNGASAGATTYYPGIYPKNDELEMCQRHIGGAWYTVLRPDKEARDAMTKKGKLKIYLRFFGGETRYENGTLTLGDGDEWGDDNYSLKFEKMGSKAVFTKSYNGLDLALYDELDAAIFVLREPKADRDALEEVGLALDGKAMNISLNGYMDGKDAVYAGVFTAPEAAAIRNGGELALMRG